jgi:ABC-type nitrate/sulfonate/bicarbonate transport system ATPase subunit
LFAWQETIHDFQENGNINRNEFLIDTTMLINIAGMSGMGKSTLVSGM